MKKTGKTLLAMLLILAVVLPLAAMIASAAPAEDYGIDEDGYVVYEIGAEDIDTATGKVTLDGSRIANAIRAKQWETPEKVGSNWMPGELQYGKLKIVNNTSYTLTIDGYNVYVPSYGTNLPVLEPSEAGTLHEGLNYSASAVVAGVKGADGNEIPVGLTPFRTANAAIKALYGKTAITLEDLVKVEETLLAKHGQQVKNSQKVLSTLPDTVTTYSQFICWYYGVNSLNELNIKQKYQIFDGNAFYVTGLGDSSILQNEQARRYAFTENGGKLYLLHEFDAEMIALGYNFFISDLYAFCFDSSICDKLTDSNMAPYTFAQYLNADSAARQQTDALLVGVSLASGETLTFDSLQVKLNGPYMGNAYSNREVPGMLSFDFSFEVEGYEPPSEDIPDEEVPLAPPTEDIPDESVPLTGEMNPALAFAALTVLSGTALAVAARRRKRK